jgi:hypothetical protein
MNYKYPDSPLSEIASSITLNTANREVLRITHDGRLVTGEGLSADEATQEAAKLLIASFEEQIQKMVETRIAAELASLRAELAVAENWVLHHQQHADDLIAENVKLRADLERFTGHGLLDCHAICDQRDAAVAERDRLRAEVERLTATLDSVPKLIGDQNDRLARERHEAVARAEKRVERLKELLRIESASAQHALAAAERAEADSARLDWLLDRSAQTYHSYSNHLGGGNYVQYHKDRDAIDAAITVAAASETPARSE